MKRNSPGLECSYATGTKSCKNTDTHGPLVVLPCTARHIPSIDNTLADVLSRNNATLFLSMLTCPPGTNGASSDLKPRLDIPELFRTRSKHIYTPRHTIKKFDEVCKKQVRPKTVLLLYCVPGPARFGRLNHQSVTISSQTSAHCL